MSERGKTGARREGSFDGVRQSSAAIVGFLESAQDAEPMVVQEVATCDERKRPADPILASVMTAW